MVIAVISDTHLPRGARHLPERCVQLIHDADLLLHAGDLVDSGTLDALRAIGPPLQAVHGNVDDADVRAQLPAERIVEAGGVRIGMIHDSGPSVGRLSRMRRHFPDADAVVFGHSHLPLHEEHDGFHLFNPGSPTERRRSPHHTMGLVHVDGGTLRFELVPLD